MAQEVADKVFEPFRTKGQTDYLGEKVTQLEHAAQCAMLAEAAGSSTEVILGAFLHDIGHLLESGDNMFTGEEHLGKHGHDRLGQQFLTSLGVPSAVTDIVAEHVNAKRYLCYQNPSYHDGLSEVSKMTLVHQGGPMEAEEADRFKNHPSFELLIQARRWDEQGKVTGQAIDPLEKYQNMFKAYMEKVLDLCDTHA